MTRRDRRRPRCFGCSLTPSTCLCATLPRVRFSTPVAIVQHYREQVKPTNTGRLFACMAEGTTVLPFGTRGQPFEPGPLEDPSIEWRVLFPRVGAPVLDPSHRPAEGRRLGLVLLDGTWTQCARMSRRVPGIGALPCFALPPGPPSIWAIRQQHRQNGQSTLEAALLALQRIEGAEAVAPVRDAFARVTARLLYLKGELASPQVPVEWRG